MSSRMTIPGMRRLRRSQARKASRLAARLAGSSGTAKAGCVTSMTGNLRPSAVVANTRAGLSAAGRWDCMTDSGYDMGRRQRGTGHQSTAPSHGAAMPGRYGAPLRAVNETGHATAPEAPARPDVSAVADNRMVFGRRACVLAARHGSGFGWLQTHSGPRGH